MPQSEYIWNVKVEKPLEYDSLELVILAGRDIQTVLPKAQKLLVQLDREHNSHHRIVKIEAAGIVDAF